MSKSAKARANRMIAVCYLLAVILVIAVLVLVIYWLPKKNGRDSAAAGMIDYAVAEKKIWKIEVLPAAESFLNAESAGQVMSVQYAAQPTLTVGSQTIALTMQLTDGSIRTENVLLTVMDTTVNWELGTDASPAAVLGADYADAAFSQPLTDFTQIGTYPIEVRLGGQSYPFTLVVTDTTKPAAVPADNLSFCVNQKLTGADFLKSCEDATEVTYSFVPEPDTATVGERETTLTITDAQGNSTVLPLKYSVKGDDQPPVFEGVADLTTINGVAISYTHNVKAIDNTDGEVTYTATLPEGFGFKKEGEYTISYEAVDQAGNQATASAKLTILPADTDLKKIDRENYMLMGYAITDELFKDADPNMTEKERAYKCYNYVQAHMYFVDNRLEYDDLEVEFIYPAALAIRQNFGDCRNYFGFSKLLYECAGIKNLMVFHPDPKNGHDRHWWNMIQIDGNWWHADATPRVGISNFFMKSDAWMDNYSKKNRNCFERDKSLYPATPTD